MQAMKGATVALGSMNRSMNLPALQRIAMEFERENDIMEQRQEMMDDAVDDAMDVGIEEEGDEVVEQVLEEIGVDLNQSVSSSHGAFTIPNLWASKQILTHETPHSSAKRLPVFIQTRCPKDALPKRSVDRVAAEVIQAMMIWRPGSLV